MPAHENLIEMFKLNKINNDYLSDMGDLYTNSVSVKDLNIYQTSLDFLMLNLDNFSSVPKRTIVKQLSCYWAMKFELAIGDPPYYPTYFKTKHELSLEKTNILITLDDLTLFKNVA